MKLKEKLAEDYGGKPRFIGDIEADIAHHAFIAGFEKAREMCVDKVNNDNKYILENLGEEEV